MIPIPHCCRTALTRSIVRKKNSSVRKDYAVTLHDGTGGPDVSVHTSDGDVKATLHLLGRIGRPARIDVRTTHGSVRLAIHREPGQAIDVHAETTNGESSFPPEARHLDSLRLMPGRVRVWLPTQFDGVVAGGTKRSSVKISPALTPYAVQLPPPPSHGSGMAKAWAVGAQQPAGCPGRDRVWAQTKNAGVRFFAYGEKDVEDDEVWDLVEKIAGNAGGG